MGLLHLALEFGVELFDLAGEHGGLVLVVGLPSVLVVHAKSIFLN